jgi:hypothetical protein
MSYKATVYKVMIASPSDVDSERDIIREVIQRWNDIYSENKKMVLLPVSWETHSAPSMEGRAQDVINSQVLKGCDMLVAVFWTRLGTFTGHSPSGTVEEIERHIEAKKPTMIYFSSAPVHPDSIDFDQYSKLKKLKTNYESRGLIEFYESPMEFRDKVNRHLAITVNNEFHATNPEEELPKTALYETFSKPSSISSLSDEAKRLLLEGSKDTNGMILRLQSIQGLEVETNNINFVEEGNPRSEALWERAIDQLLQANLISDPGHEHEVFRVTADGFDVAGNLSTKT